jgi:hypothetical protein
MRAGLLADKTYHSLKRTSDLWFIFERTYLKVDQNDLITFLLVVMNGDMINSQNWTTCRDWSEVAFFGKARPDHKEGMNEMLSIIYSGRLK